MMSEYARDVRRRRRRHADHVIAAARARGIGEIEVELVVTVTERDLILLSGIVEAARGDGGARARSEESQSGARDRRARERVVDDAVRVDRQIEVLQIAAGEHDDLGDPLQLVRELRMRSTEQRRAGRRAGPAEAQLIGVDRRVVRHDAAHSVDAVGRRRRDVRERVVAIELDDPARELPFVLVGHVVEVGVVPHHAVQEPHARHAADVDRDARARGLHRVVPVHGRGVRDPRADREVLIQHGAEPQRDRAARCERTVGRRVVRGEQRRRDRDTVRRAVHRPGLGDEREVARDGNVDVIPDRDRVGRNGADVRRR